MPEARPLEKALAAIEALEGDAKKGAEHDLPSTAEELWASLRSRYTLHDYNRTVLERIESGTLFDGVPTTAYGPHALRVFRMMGGGHNDAIRIAEALFNDDSAMFLARAINYRFVTPDQVEVLCNDFQRYKEVSVQVRAKQQGRGEARRRDRRPRQDSPAQPERANSTTTQRRPAAAAQAPLSVRGLDVAAVLDTGAEVAIVTEEAADRLSLKLRPASRPLLRPLWPGAPYPSPTAPNLWINAVVVGFKAPWDILIGKKDIERIGILTATPAMQRRMKDGKQTADHPGKTLDNLNRAATEADYEDFPVDEPSRDLSVVTPAEAQAEIPPIPEPVLSRPMRARLGLPAGFFKESRDPEFLRLDALYPSVTRADIAAKLLDQCSSTAERKLLLDELTTGAAALRDYPGGNPPPAAYAPIKPPMRSDAAPIYVVQHTLSQAAQEAVNSSVELRLRFGIDEPSDAFAQMPIFTKSKPNTTERRVLFDDSANNSLNMLSVGMALPNPMERALFLRDARVISSIDMASFFTQLRIHADVADFWTYDGGAAGRIRTRRMVQGNSESPAIAQAFISHVLGKGLPDLRTKLLMYIDNIYLKSTNGDVNPHIRDVGALVRCLAEANITVNMRVPMVRG
ncbi:hypothetical protein LPJ81_002661 [Coemansia sp. IMI 209127]|nr:hypothetical protein LPJ81_002661 [Coemansia sp. IMI 209127]